MYVFIKHDITDLESFFEKGGAMAERLPDGLQQHQFLPAKEGAAAFCVWRTDSLERLTRFVDDSLRGASVQEYHVVDDRNALGLPA